MKIDISQAYLYGVSDEAAQEFVEWRKSIKKPLTQRAFERAMAVAVKCSELGISPDKAIEIVIDKEGEGRYPVKTHANPDNSPYVGSLKTFKHGARFGAKWQQSQDKLIIQELRDALSEVKGDLFYQLESKHNAKMASIYPSYVKANAAITKADNYLKVV